MSVASVITELWWAEGPRRGDVLDGGPGTRGDRRAEEHTGESADAVAERIRAGDEKAFDAVVLEMFPLLARVAARLLGSMAEGEDAAQDVLVRLWLNREALRPATSLRVYLLGAVRNRALNVVRDRRTAERNLSDPAVPLPTVTAPDAGILGTERAALVARALGALVPRHRLAVELRYGARASFAEVGAALGVSPRAAEQIVRRAVVALRRALGEAER